MLVILFWILGVTIEELFNSDNTHRKEGLAQRKKKNNETLY